MFCSNCGKPIPEKSAFCPECGTKVNRKTTRSEKAVNRFHKKESAPGKNKMTVIILAVAVLLIAAVIATVLLVLRSPKLTLAKAVKNSVGEWETAIEFMDVSVTGSKETPVRSSGVLQLTGMELGRLNLELPKTTHLRWESATNLPDREVACQMTVVMGNTDVFSLYAGVQDALLTVYSPELLGTQALQVNTEQAGADLKRLGAPEFTWGWNGNFFEREEKSLLSGAEEPLKASDIQVKKQEKTTVQVNGNSVECVRYAVTIPGDAALPVLYRWEEMLNAREREETEFIGRVEKILSDVLFAMEPEAGESLNLDFYLKDQQVMAVAWTDPAGEQELRLSVGGGSRYVDDWSLKAKTEEGAFSVRSSGDHGASDGCLTDSTILTCEDDLGTSSASLSLNYGVEDGNLQLQVHQDKFVLELQGKVTREGDYRTLDVDQLTVGSQEGKFRFAGSVTQMPYAPIPAPAESTVSLSEMEPEDMEEMEKNMQRSIRKWQERLLKELLGSFGIGD